jgi:hypothetical protein
VRGITVLGPGVGSPDQQIYNPRTNTVDPVSLIAYGGDVLAPDGRVFISGILIGLANVFSGRTELYDTAQIKCSSFLPRIRL